MTPLYYRGEKLITKQAVMNRLHIASRRLEGYLAILEADPDTHILVHGHRLFLDDEAMLAKRKRKDLLALKKLVRAARKNQEALRTSLLAPGYCTFRLGIYRGW